MMKSIILLAIVAFASANASAIITSSYDGFKGQLPAQQVYEAPALQSVHYAAAAPAVMSSAVATYPAAAPIIQSSVIRRPLFKRSVQLTESYKAAAPIVQAPAYHAVAAAPALSYVREAPLIRSHYVEALSRPLLSTFSTFRAEPALRFQRLHYAEPLRTLAVARPLLAEPYMTAAAPLAVAAPLAAAPLVAESFKGQTWAEPIKALPAVQQTFAEPIKAMPAVQQTFAEPIKAMPAVQVAESFKGETWAEPIKALPAQQTFQEPIKAMPAVQQTFAEPIKQIAAQKAL